jgi:hypothetical protein
MSYSLLVLGATVLLPTSIVLNMLLYIVGFGSGIVATAGIICNLILSAAFVAISGVRVEVLRKEHLGSNVIDSELESDEKALDSFDKTLEENISSYP